MVDDPASYNWSSDQIHVFDKTIAMLIPLSTYPDSATPTNNYNKTIVTS